MNKMYTDMKAQLANSIATESRIQKGEQDLLGKISKHVTEIDLANTMNAWQHAKDEQAIVDYNNALIGQQLAEEANAWAQYEATKGDNLDKLLSEYETKYNQFLSAKDATDTYGKLASETDPIKRQQLLYALKYGFGARNPFTGKSTFEV